MASEHHTTPPADGCCPPKADAPPVRAATRIPLRIGIAALALALEGCAVVAVADAAVTVAATAVKVTAKTIGAAVDLVMPDSKD